MSPKRILILGASGLFGLLLVVPLMGSSCDDNVDCHLPVSGLVIKVPDSAAGQLQCSSAQNAELAQLNAANLNNRPSKSSSGP